MARPLLAAPGLLRRLLQGALFSTLLASFWGCDRPERQPSPKASATQTGSTTPSLERWTEALDAKRLKGADMDSPRQVVLELSKLHKKRSAVQTSGIAETEASDADDAKLLSLSREADEVLEKGFKLRDHPWYSIVPPIDWGKNPNRDSNWHYVLNSLRPIGPLVRAYEATGKPKYYERLKAVLLDWIDYNMARDRPNEKKWHDMGTGLRAGRLAYVLGQELSAKHPDVETVGRLVWALDRHVRFLSDPEEFTPGNHGIYMMTGLQKLLNALPELHEHARFEKYVRSRMKELVQSQFGPEGFHLEHSPDYHLQVTTTFARLSEQRLFREVPELDRAATLAQSRIFELHHPNGDLVMLGDSERRSYAPRSGSTPGQEPTLSAAASGTPLRVYPKVGYAVFRSHWGDAAAPSDDYLLLGAGHHSTVHKQADHLSFEWSFQGQPVLIDSGKYTYNKGRWRDFFASTRAGNALEIDNQDHQVKAPLNQPALKTWGQFGESGYYVHAQLQHQRSGTEQQRLLVWIPGDFLVVLDRMRSRRSHTYRQWFHFHESLEMRRDGRQFLVRGQKGTPLLHVQPLNTEPEIEAELVRGQTEPRIQGWVSPKYKRKVARYSLGIKIDGKDGVLATLFARTSIHSARLDQDEQTLTVSWLDQHGKKGFKFSPHATSSISSL